MNVHQRFRRIEDLLGGALTESLRDENFERLVIGSVGETDDLDFKSQLYADEKGKVELAKDVAAFANHIGGVIIIGVADTKGVASKVLPVAGANDAELRRMRSVVAERVHPYPSLDLVKCESNTGGVGFILVIVSRSAVAPHAVSDPNDPSLRYWVRSGSQTLALPETAVADRYRSRFDYAAGRLGRLNDVLSQGIDKIDRRTTPWLVVAVVPESAGSAPLEGRALPRYRDFLRNAPPTGLNGAPLVSADSVSVGHRRVVAGSPHHADGLMKGPFAEMHTDGSSVVAGPLYTDEQDGPIRLFDTAIVDGVASCLNLAALHATRNAGTGGAALVEARILEPRTGDEPPSRSLVLYWDRPINGFSFPDEIPGGRSLFVVPPSQHTVDLGAVADSPTEWVAASWVVSADLVQAFGQLEPLAITREGKIRATYLGRGMNEIKAFAQRVGIELDQEPAGF